MQYYDVNSVRPQTLNNMVGNKHIIEVVRVALDAAQIDNRRFDHSIMTGAPGLGKTQLCHVIANEMGVDLHEVLGQSITNAGDLNALLLSAKERDIIYIDECHELAKVHQTALYLALDQRKLVISGKGKAPLTLPLADFTLLLSTTDEYSILQPLRHRARLELGLQPFSEKELVQVLRQRIQDLSWQVQEDIVPFIAQRSRGTPRLALRLLQACHRCSRSESDPDINLRHFLWACELEQLDELGLGPMEQMYMNILLEGPTRLNMIASRIGIPVRTISDVTEGFLIRSRLICKDEQGRRQLTLKGYNHMAQKLPISL
jgi:Holliday junction DNA helicase RuvB